MILSTIWNKQARVNFSNTNKIWFWAEMTGDICNWQLINFSSNCYFLIKAWKKYHAKPTRQDPGTSFNRGYFQNFRQAPPSFLYGTPSSREKKLINWAECWNVGIERCHHMSHRRFPRVAANCWNWLCLRLLQRQRKSQALNGRTFSCTTWWFVSCTKRRSRWVHLDERKSGVIRAVFKWLMTND